MNFENHKKELIIELKNSSEFIHDFALKRVVQILENIKTKKELRKERSLINRISIDSVENWSTIEKIISFTKNNTS